MSCRRKWAEDNVSKIKILSTGHTAKQMAPTTQRNPPKCARADWPRVPQEAAVPYLLALVFLLLGSVSEEWVTWPWILDVTKVGTSGGGRTGGSGRTEESAVAWMLTAFTGQPPSLIFPFWAEGIGCDKRAENREWKSGWQTRRNPVSLGLGWWLQSWGSGENLPLMNFPLRVFVWGMF